MSKIDLKRHSHSPNFRGLYPERCEEIYKHITEVGKDKLARTNYFLGLEMIKTLKKYCQDKGYADKEAEGFVFLDKYMSYEAWIMIRDEYDTYVSERVKDIMADLNPFSNFSL